MNPTYSLDNTLTLKLNNCGNLLGYSVNAANLGICFADSWITLETDRGCLSTKDYAATLVDKSDTHLCFEYNYPQCVLSVKYQLTTDKQYFQRFITVLPKQKLTVYKTRSIIKLNEAPIQTIDYKTFWHASATAFVRFDGYGIFTGFANPYFTAHEENGYLDVSFEPSLILQADEAFEFDSNFFGIYKASGKLIEQQMPKTPFVVGGKTFTRYVNPSGCIALDRNEIRGFKAFVDEHMELNVDKFMLFFYNFFIPLPQQPNTDEEEQLYYRYIDNFVELGGDVIIFNPLVRQRTPTPSLDSQWEIAPQGSRAERIIKYATDKGLKYGIYMGSAPDNSEYCNSPMTPYASTVQRPNWKKIGQGGEVARENCIACDDFAEWYYTVQKNTIINNGITLWDWDPGPGNAFFCYSANHGHIPGKGGYKGFRNAMKVAGKLKHDCPGLYIQGFHGTKEYGIWGLRYFDQHEAYWEQCPYGMATVYPDISEDRLTASGMRFQSWWNQNFRFLPGVINHSLTHRMCQYCGSPQELTKLFDYIGWKYALMSGLAAGASITVPMIPYDVTDAIGKEYVAFYRKWVDWGRDTFEYHRNSVPFGSQVVVGGIDGYSKFIGNKGFIFLCNPAPMPAEITFELGDEIGLTVEGNYTLKQLYPIEAAYYDAAHNTAEFEYGGMVTATVDPYEVMLLELCPIGEHLKSPLLCNINGVAALEQGKIIVTQSCDEYGKQTSGAVYAANKINAVSVNGVELPFEQNGDYVTFNLLYGGNELPRYLNDWSNGIAVCNNEAAQSLTTSTSFYASPQILELLKGAETDKMEEITAITNNLLGKHSDNFAWALPHRLHIVVPIADSGNPPAAELALNGQPIPLTQLKADGAVTHGTMAYYADITDYVKFGEQNEVALSLQNLAANQFLGAYLQYPNKGITDKVMPSDKPLTQAQTTLIVDTQKLLPWFDNTDNQVRINNAWIAEGIVEEFREYTLCAHVNIDAKDLLGVFAGVQVCIDSCVNSAGVETLHSNEALHYNERRGIWTKKLKMGNRHLLIVDDEQLFVWAVTKDGYMSETFEVSLSWRL